MWLTAVSSRVLPFAAAAITLLLTILILITRAGTIAITITVLTSLLIGVRIHQLVLEACLGLQLKLIALRRGVRRWKHNDLPDTQPVCDAVGIPDLCGGCTSSASQFCQCITRPNPILQPAFRNSRCTDL